MLVNLRATANERLSPRDSFRQIRQILEGLHARMRGLESTWREQEHRKFADAFEQTMKVLGGFLEASREHVSFLGKKAAHVEEYLKQR